MKSRFLDHMFENTLKFDFILFIQEIRNFSERTKTFGLGRSGTGGERKDGKVLVGSELFLIVMFSFLRTVREG